MTLNNLIRFVFVSLSLSTVIACGGGGSSKEDLKPVEPVPTTTQSYTVTVIDGYLRAATVWLDLNNDGVQNIDEPTTVTQDNGTGILTLPFDIDPTKYSVLVYAEAGKTFDESLNGFVERDFLLASPEGEQIITPLTTLVYLNSRKIFDKAEATSLVITKLNLISQNIFEDFIATGNTEQATLAADLVRLGLMPETKNELTSLINNSQITFDSLDEYLTLRTRDGSPIRVIRDSNGILASDTDLDGIADTEDQDIDGDSILNDQDAFPYTSTERQDLDNDGIGNNNNNNSDTEINGDGVPNADDENPYLAEFNTINNPGELNLSYVKEGNIEQGKWQYFTVESPVDVMLNITLSNLSGDVDLYVRQSNFPTKFEYQCRSNESNIRTEKCLEHVLQVTTYNIGLLARQDSTFSLLATTETIVYKKVVLLLHGLASEPSTWDLMINDDSFFNGQCQTLSIDNDPISVTDVNKDGISCFNLEFGSLDRGTTFSATGLDNKQCVPASGCNGDYTTFEGLGFEVEAAITRIVDHLGQDTEIFMLGHSRGGLAARSYLQNEQTIHKLKVKGFATTGTPHQGSPLGRFYQYMHNNCIPKSAYRQDNGKCEDNWEVIELLNGTRTFFGYNYSKEYNMDLQAPSIDFLSPDKSSIRNLNDNLLSLDNLIIGQLTYEGSDFGVLGKSPNYDLYDYGRWFSGDHPHPDTLRYIENGQTRASFIGDGIVPSHSQKLSLLLEKEGIIVTKKGINKETNILHTEETSEVTDLDWLFEGLYPSLGWK